MRERESLWNKKTQLLSLILVKLEELNFSIFKIEEKDDESQKTWDLNFSEFENLSAELFKIDRSLKNMESLPKSTEALKDIMTTVQGQIDNLNNQLDAFAQMKDKAVDAMPTIEKNLNEMTESLSNSVSSIENMSTEIRDSVKQSIKETNDMLINQIKGLDEQMQKEVTKIVEIMGSNLASLSEKFVSDYSPLTNQLVNLVNSLGSVKKKPTKKSE